MTPEGHVNEYKRARRRFRLLFYVLCFANFSGCSAAVGQPVTGWWLLGICAGVVLLEIFFWTNVALPRAVTDSGRDGEVRYNCLAGKAHIVGKVVWTVRKC